MFWASVEILLRNYLHPTQGTINHVPLSPVLLWVSTALRSIMTKNYIKFLLHKQNHHYVFGSNFLFFLAGCAPSTAS